MHHLIFAATYMLFKKKDAYPNFPFCSRLIPLSGRDRDCKFSTNLVQSCASEARRFLSCKISPLNMQTNARNLRFLIKTFFPQRFKGFPGGFRKKGKPVWLIRWNATSGIWIWSIICTIPHARHPFESVNQWLWLKRNARAAVSGWEVNWVAGSWQFPCAGRGS